MRSLLRTFGHEPNFYPLRNRGQCHRNRDHEQFPARVHNPVSKLLAEPSKAWKSGQKGQFESEERSPRPLPLPQKQDERFTESRIKGLGGAGGIRTHEWRFCRPLPWATWVPRRNFKYSKSPRTHPVRQPAATFSISTFSQRVQEGQFSLHAGSVQLLPAAWD